MYIFDDFWYFGRYPKKSRVGLKKVEVNSTFLGNSTGQLLGIWEYRYICNVITQFSIVLVNLATEIFLFEMKGYSSNVC